MIYQYNNPLPKPGKGNPGNGNGNGNGCFNVCKNTPKHPNAYKKCNCGIVTANIDNYSNAPLIIALFLVLIIIFYKRLKENLL